jgi:hypothetical protein
MIMLLPACQGDKSILQEAFGWLSGSFLHQQHSSHARNSSLWVHFSAILESEIDLWRKE